MPIMTPMAENWKIVVRETPFQSLRGINKNKVLLAIMTRHHTNGTAFKVINFPKIAVNPQMNTQKCMIK